MTHRIKTMLKIQVEGARCDFEIHGKWNIANALRRALLSDVCNIAPDCVTIRKNTSCQTDEFIAHRIGLIPFCASHAEEATSSARLTVHGRTAMARDIVSSAYTAHTDMPIMKLGPDQSLDLDISFRTGTGDDHARFSHIGAVRFASQANCTKMGFEVITDVPPLVYLSAALESLLNRINTTISFVETDYESKHVVVSSK